jgi:hypothetical protein
VDEKLTSAVMNSNASITMLGNQMTQHFKIMMEALTKKKPEAADVFATTQNYNPTSPPPVTPPSYGTHQAPSFQTPPSIYQDQAR